MGNNRGNKGKHDADRDTGQDAPGVGLIILTQAAGAAATPSPAASNGESGAMAAT